MKFRTVSGKELTISRLGVNADLPLIRSDSQTYQITKGLWGIYTPSTGISGALLLGSENDCREALLDYGGDAK